MPSILKCRIVEARNITRKEINNQGKGVVIAKQDMNVPIYCEVKFVKN